MALDADEALSANVLDSAEWRAALAAEPGTVLRLRWANLLPGCRRAWIPPEPAPCVPTSGLARRSRFRSFGLAMCPFHRRT